MLDIDKADLELVGCTVSGVLVDGVDLITTVCMLSDCSIGFIIVELIRDL